MNKRILTVVVFLTTLILGSCKKTEKSTTPMLSGAGYNSTHLDGRFIFTKSANIYGDSLGEAYQESYLIFFKSPLHPDSLPSGVGKDVGTVHLNNIMFSKSMPGQYFDSTYSALNLPFKINNVGSDASYLPLNITLIQPFPIFTGLAYLPDTLHLQKSNVIKIKNYSGCTAISLALDISYGNKITTNLSVDDSIINMPSLNYPFPGVYDILLSITFTTSKVWRIGDKNYLITTSFIFYKAELPVSF